MNYQRINKTFLDWHYWLKEQEKKKYEQVRLDRKKGVRESNVA